MWEQIVGIRAHVGNFYVHVRAKSTETFTNHSIWKMKRYELKVKKQRIILKYNFLIYKHFGQV